jgi:hypothetical protein
MLELVTFLLAISIASERVVEIIKNSTNLTVWVTNPKKKVAIIHMLTILSGTGFSYLLIKDANLPGFFKSQYGFILLGIMSGAGSSVWNSALVAVSGLVRKPAVPATSAAVLTTVATK